MHRFVILLASLTVTLAATAGSLTLNKGDHICLIGSAVADRMQHHGWMETLIHAKFPTHELVFRNLAAAGDEVATWHRSENFGSRDEWLKKTGADVIFAFYGFNESFKGQPGIDKFKKALDKFVKETKAMNYGSRGPPRLVLFAPIANEKLGDPDMPDPQANNANLRLYVAAMAETAKANNVLFVDLFAISQRLYAEAAKEGRALTFNTFLLTESGDKALAPEIFRALFSEAPPSGDFERLRAAVLEKNARWHSRYRTVDGYNVYGGRSALAYQPGKGNFISDRNAPLPHVSNYKIMQQEMSQRDVMTANRDRRVWAVAQGRDFKVDDSNLTPVETVESNKPDVSPYLSGEEAIQRMTMAKGCKVSLFA